MARPRHDRLVVVTVERAVVDPLRLEEDHRVVVLDRGDQQPLGVVRIRRQHRLQSAHVGEQALRALAVRLPAVDAAAARHAHGHRCGELGARSVAQACGFRDQLVEARVDVVGELDLDHGTQAVGAHSHGGADDAAFGDRRVEDPRAAVLGLQPFGAAEHAAEVADVLAERRRCCRRAPSSRPSPSEWPRSSSSRSSPVLHLSTLPLQMLGHLLEHVLEDAPGAGDPTVEQCAVALRLLGRGQHLAVGLGDEVGVLLLGPLAEGDEVRSSGARSGRRAATTSTRRPAGSETDRRRSSAPRHGR